MSNEKKLANGMYYNAPHENAPDFVKGKISLNKGMFQNFLEELETDKKGYVRFDMLKSKAGKIYFTVDDWKPSKIVEEKNVVEDDDVPF